MRVVKKNIKKEHNITLWARSICFMEKDKSKSKLKKKYFKNASNWVHMVYLQVQHKKFYCNNQFKNRRIKSKQTNFIYGSFHTKCRAKIPQLSDFRALFGHFAGAAQKVPKSWLKLPQFSNGSNFLINYGTANFYISKIKI